MADENQAQAALALLEQLMGNPETRRQTQMLVKKVNPKASIPEIDAAIPIYQELKKTNDTVAELRAELTRRDARDEINSKQSVLQGQGYSEDGIRKLEGLMVERGIGDYEAAAALFDRMNPPPAPAAPSYAGQRFFQDTGEDFKKFAANTGAWVDEETGRALADFRSGRAN